MKEHGPIEWRNRIREISLQMSQLQEERENLINKLEAEGFLLIEEVNNSLEKLEAKHIYVIEDMSDWRNWQVGDFIELIQGQYLPAGSICPVIELEDKDYEGNMPALIFCDNIGEWPSKDNMKWHSRPTKQST